MTVCAVLVEQREEDKSSTVRCVCLSNTFVSLHFRH